MPPVNTTKDTLTIRVAHELAEQVRTIAARESESQSTVLRRLLRRGIETERNAVTSGAPSSR